MVTPTGCPGLRTLREFAAGRLGDPDRGSLMGHLETCARCRGQLEGLEATAKNSLGGEEAGWTETEIDPTETSEYVSGAEFPAPEDDEVTERLEQQEKSILLPSTVAGSLGRIASYEVQGLLGRGGMGLVFRAFDPSLNRTVAIKVLAPRLASSARARRRFLREARSAAAINHPNVVTIHSVGEQQGLPYLVMERIAGRSLRQRIRSGPPLRPTEVLRISLQVAQGLEAAHKQVVIHRDVKPANIMLEEGVERVKLTDFGLALAALTESELTSADHIVGTPEYMSPEQVRGETVDMRSDLFSLGCVMHALVAGQSPFRGAHALDSLRRVTDLDPPLLNTINPAVPAGLAELVNRLLSKDPEDRPESATEVVEALRQMLADAGPLADSMESETLPTTPLARPLLAGRAGGGTIAWKSIGGWLTGGVLACLAGVGIWWAVFLNDGQGKTGRTKSGDGPPLVSQGQPGSTDSGTDSAPVLVVGQGPDAPYHSLGAALAVVSRRGTTIRINDDATYDGPVTIANPPLLSGLTIEGAGGAKRPTLTAPGVKNTIVTIEGTPNVTIRGVRIASNSEQFGLTLEGYVAGVTVEDVEFGKIGESRPAQWSHVWVRGETHGDTNSPFRFERCRFEPWLSGLVLQGSGDQVIAHGRITGCRFEAKTRQLELLGAVQDLLIEHNVFARGETAILCDGLSEGASQIRIVNNSFFATDRWIDPTSSAADLPEIQVSGNALFEMPTIDVPAGRLEELSREGWSFSENVWEHADAEMDKPALASSRPRLEVRSRDPASAEFLRPAPGSALLRAGHEPAYYGAIAP